MAAKAQEYRAILTSLFIEEDAPKAVALTIARNTDNAYSYSRFVKHKICANDEYRHPQYLQRLRHFREVHFSPQDPEWDLIQTLHDSPLKFQHRVEANLRPYLAAHPELDKALKQIRSIADPFYDYNVPYHLIQANVKKQREARELKHAKATTISDLQTILTKARAWRDQERFLDPWDLVPSALFLCGRRVIEVLETLKWAPHGEYTALVSGITKQDFHDPEIVIPLLCPYKDFDELMTKIREARLPVKAHSNRLHPRFVRQFGRWYNHSERRNIYAEAGYRIRTETGFFPEMSKVMWIDKAIGHSSNVAVSSGNLTYQALVFTDERE